MQKPALSARRLLYSSFWVSPLPFWLTLFFLGPLLLLVWLSFWDVRNFVLQPDFQLDNWVKILSANYFWQAYGRTFLGASCVAAIASLLALPCSLVIGFILSTRAKLTVLGLFVVPFFTSYLVRVYSWQIYLTDNGVISNLLAAIGLETGSLLSSKFAMQVGYVTLTLPLVVVIQSISMLSFDRTLINAAYNLGCGPVRVFFSVLLPGTRAGLILGALFAFIFSFGDFVSPTYMGGGKFPTLAILITDTVKSGQQWPRAAVIAIVMIGTLLIVALTSLKLAYRRK
ncbi:ABC transporter permease [Pseudovibrio brasiliensis]|uniref:ABC transporter permease n=1 Tax=Pseudovibrio brasiliensis TaxID=1898042 RepID=A0ABX8AZF9_9HYPH|nr:ABC transporter permease [Pseudovibrio brasiliensis]QUS59026.1 ABC transporter permease [Pseudovibrio brasiliensis]